MKSPYPGPNRLLRSLSDGDFALLAPDLTPVSLAQLEPLETAGEVPERVYFPEGSIASVVAILRSQKNFEVGLIGWEGMTGTSVLARAPSPFDCYVQFTGRALMVPTMALAVALDMSLTLRAALSLKAHVRSGVTQTLHLLESEELIRSTRGRIEILNRANLRIRAGNAYGKTERS